MPLAPLVWGVGLLMIGSGVKLGGEGLDEASNATGKATIAFIAAGAGYLYLKKRGVI